MAYFPDLSPYSFIPSSSQAIATRNVGWLEAGADFPIAEPTDALLDRLWRFCLISVWPTRGVHFCPFCKLESLTLSERHGARVSLGSAEIRVFDANGQGAFAAPNLIYHYVEEHHYLPPSEFLDALESGPQPTSPEYGEMLTKAGAAWTATPLAQQDLAIFRFVKRDGQVEREWIVKPKA